MSAGSSFRRQLISRAPGDLSVQHVGLAEKIRHLPWRTYPASVHLTAHVGGHGLKSNDNTFMFCENRVMLTEINNAFYDVREIKWRCSVRSPTDCRTTGLYQCYYQRHLLPVRLRKIPIGGIRAPRAVRSTVGKARPIQSVHARCSRRTHCACATRTSDCFECFLAIFRIHWEMLRRWPAVTVGGASCPAPAGSLLMVA